MNTFITLHKLRCCAKFAAARQLRNSAIHRSIYNDSPTLKERMEMVNDAIAAGEESMLYVEERRVIGVML